jgi:enoyl-[acyl-carrier protein] reductase I
MKLTRTTRAQAAAGATAAAGGPKASGNGSTPADVAASVKDSVVSAQGAATTTEAPARAARSHRLVRPCPEVTGSGLLAGKKALVFGVANDHSIAWGIAKAMHDQGALVGFSSMPQLIKRRVRPLAASIGSRFVEGCDVREDDEVRDVFAKWSQREGDLDILVHAVAYAEKEDLMGHFSDVSRTGFHTALDISVYSLIAMAREARPYMKPGSSIMTMTYYAAEKVVPNYNVMGVAKAALEATTRYLAADLGPAGIRVNAISAGPVRTLSAHGIAGFRTMHNAFAEVTPLRRHITIEDVAGTAVYLASPLSGQTTGETIYVDGGFNILGLPVVEE